MAAIDLIARISMWIVVGAVAVSVASQDRADEADSLDTEGRHELGCEV